MRARVASVALLALASCSTASVVNTTFNFDRATDVDFLCLRVESTGVTALPLDSCGLNAADNTSTTGAAHLYAVVTQSERGELAVVDLAVSQGISLIDNSPDIPGYSFIPVGALPTALISDIRTGATPSSVWIASTGERAIERIDAATVLYNPRRASDAGREVRHSQTRLPMNGAPRDLGLDTVGGRTLLYATVPDRSAVAVFDVTDPLRPVDMGFTPVTAPGGMDASTGAAPAHPLALTVDRESHRVYVSDDRSNYVHVLEGNPLVETGRVDMGAPTRALAVTGMARRLTCNAEGVDPDHYARARYLYAAHATTGAVLVYDLTRGAKVLPNRLPAPNAQRRLLDPTLSADRVALTAPAVGLVAINTSEYRGVNPAGEVVVPDACRTLAGCRGLGAVDPTQLHGVFVGAVLRNGVLAIIDVDDYDAPARARSYNVVDNANGYRFVRHAPRASTALTNAPAVTNAPVLTAVVRDTQRVQQTEGPTNPALGCLRPRTAGEITPCNLSTGDAGVASFGVELAPRLTLNESLRPDAGADASATPQEPSCDASSPDASVDVDLVDPDASVRPDPYTLRNEAWGLTYEGVLPGLDLYGAAFTMDGARAVVELPGAQLCTRGTLADGEFTHDQLTLLGAPTPVAADAAMCAMTFGTATARSNRDFVINEAYQERLVLDLPAGVTIDLLRRCFPMAAHVQVRANDQWVVVGSRNGYLSAIRAEAVTGRCVIDAERQDTVETIARSCLTERVPVSRRTGRRCLAGRACMAALSAQGSVTLEETPVFANSFFCVQVFPAVVSEMTDGGVRLTRREPTRDVQFTFAINGGWDTLALSAGVFPVSARFLPNFDRFYVVDTQQAGLIEFRTNPLARARIFN